MSQVLSNQRPATQSRLPGPNTIRWTTYVWVAVVLVGVLQGGVLAVQWLIVPSSVRPLRHTLAELPRELGKWNGKDVEPDRRLVNAVGADEQVDRMYRGAESDVVSLHYTAWLSPGNSIPHVPAICYKNNGYKLIGARTEALPGRPQVRVALETYEYAGQRVTICYWFQRGDFAYVDLAGARRVGRAHWGRRELPPLTKTLMQTDDADAAESRLLELAGRIYEFNCGL